MIAFGFFFALVISGCGQGSTGAPPAPPKIAPQGAAWSKIISSHTAGIVSRKSAIRVVFSSDVVEPARVGQSAAANLMADPPVAGSVTFASARELALTPQDELESGRFYRFSVMAKGLTGMGEMLAPYEFVVQVQPRQFEVQVAGIGVDARSEAHSTLTGTLITADAEAPEVVEKLLSASYLEKPATLTWQHQTDGRTHEFTIAGIERQREVRPVVLRWDGAALGAAIKGERSVDVPPRDQFTVTQVQAVQTDGEQYVQVFFSEKLDARQNLRGLVRLGSGASTERIEDTVLKIFPAKNVEGDVTVTLDAGIRNVRGDKLAAVAFHTVSFPGVKPQVRFVGKGVILPDNPVLSVPFEAVNVRSVHVTAMRVYENNIGQFLQVNKLDGQQDLGRVGRYLWRKKIHLQAPQPNRWNRYALDVTELFQNHPGGLFRLLVSVNRSDSTYSCPGDTAETVPVEPPLANEEDFNQRESSAWDAAEEYFGADGREDWNERENPCRNAFFRYSETVRDARNFIASNIGMVAKRDQRGQMLVVTTDLRSAKPLSGVKLSVMNFQNQTLETATSDSNGLATLKVNGSPFYVLAESGGQKGYLKVSQGTALPVSHFDVGGEKVNAGLKGHIYGERGVWRPGDDIYLTFVLQDEGRNLPVNHPVTMELRNPSGQLVQSLTNTAPLDRFYKFAMKTAADAPTGDWTAKAILGGTSFSRTVKIETVMPNRLKIDLDVGKGKLGGSKPLRGKLAAAWLTGASASGLKAEVQMRLNKAPTRFNRYADFTFDDPARDFAVDPVTIFEGELDATGKATFEHGDAPAKEAPGMLMASLTTRVFEPGGAFSINRQTAPFSPYDRYLGIKLPKGDVARNMLLTDTPHTVQIATLSADGKPVSVKDLDVTLYQIEWRWWWDKTGESLAQYASASDTKAVAQGKVSTSKGSGSWNFEIKYPQWGRYLVRVCDPEGGHCTGQIFYIDWPAWAGRAQEQGGPGASVLSFSANKKEYTVGETATIQLPGATQGRALVTVENGTGILESRWVELDKERTRFDVPLTKAMSPNVYVSVTLIQPHADKKNDRPIRLYGVIPLLVSDPQTRLRPQLAVPAEWLPESKASVEVSEAGGRDMTYTLAIVDEGLLGLTNFKTPELHEEFYRREALGVTTWDLFDQVAGAYGGELEKLLALGGSDAGSEKEPDANKKRFPPVVKFLGPFKLKAGAKARHEFQLPPYVGTVRAMVVAAQANAYGSAEKSVFVRKPLMLLPTLPRVVGPEEEVTVPVSIFVMDPSIKEVTLKLEPDSQFTLVGGNTVKINFAKPEEKMGLLRIKSGARLGKGRLQFVATSDAHRAQAEVFLEVRSPNPVSTRAQRKALQPGETWETKVVPHGLPGTNVVTLEVAAVPPLDLERRLGELIRYPHGCLEQVTSAAFPQLFLPTLMKLDDTRKKEIESHINTAIQRLRGFQQPNGSFAYWPGGFGVGAAFDTRGAWATNYAGHFLVEAARLGYHVPATMLADWVRFQKQAAQAWTQGNATPPLDQAFRLYSLAAAGQVEIGAMNRLRESSPLPSTARWMLAAAYKVAGQANAATDLVKADRVDFGDYGAPDSTFGTRLRDAAVVLNSMVLLGQVDRSKPLVDEVSAQLASEAWLDTQSMAYGLMAMSRFVGAGKVGEYTYERSVAGRNDKARTSAPIDTSVLRDFPPQGAPLIVKNTSQRTLFFNVTVRGIARAGDDDASASGLTLEVDYSLADGRACDLTQVRQGEDVVAEVTVKNTSPVRIDNIAFSQMVAAGYEIANERMEGAADTGKRSAAPRQGPFFFPDGSPGATSAQIEHVDIRDDRVLRYFALKAGESISFKTRLTAAYLGRFYQPSLAVEAMYDATKHARVKGRWVEVVPAP
jgi:uncharacterized protein YfaS (alpha-2-macroglobulin family)